MHRDEQFFPQPEAFSPERWLDGLQKRLPRYAYLPFGGGPRLCIGNAFALTEATLVLAAVWSRFQLRAVDPKTPPLLPSITLRPKRDIWVRVEASAVVKSGVTQGTADGAIASS
jgi:cytochrome P450